ncbi:MAG: SDR family NAD(P)-dependent oxidoreductase [Polyangiaceae bacterium]|nr:SDR family NAD(P)-dependent oxidoreductase [Polyangiaceae bacterium]
MRASVPRPSFADRVAWITGAGTGIGRACAVELARRGASVAVSGRREAELERVAAEVRATGARALVVPCDVTREEQVVAAVARAGAELGRLDVVIANAGFSVAGRIADLSLDDWRRQLEINVLGLVATVKHALPALTATGGRIVLVGSVSAYLATPGLGAYAASKHAVRAIGETLAAELAGSGVSCTTVHPGFVESEIARVDNQGRHHPERRDPRPRRLMWTAEAAARAIVDAAEARRRELVFTGHGRAAVAIARHLPGAPALALSIGERRRGQGRARARAPGEPGALEAAAPIELAPAPEVIAGERSLASLYARALLVAARRREGAFAGDSLPALAARQRAVVVEPARVEAYRAVCGPVAGVAPPPAWAETLFLGPMARVVTDPAFPLSPLGLIHVGQRIVQRRPLEVGRAYDVVCRLAAARRGPRGIELEFGLVVEEADGEPVWEGLTRVLSRAAAVRGGGGTARRDAAAPLAGGREVELVAPSSAGVDYARVSGDWNPHHLWPVTARPLGYERPIAHGMWLLARALGVIDGVVSLAGPLVVECAFKRPLYLPGSARLRHTTRPLAEAAVEFEVRDPRGAPHLVGTVTAG